MGNLVRLGWAEHLGPFELRIGVSAARIQKIEFVDPYTGPHVVSGAARKGKLLYSQIHRPGLYTFTFWWAHPDNPEQWRPSKLSLPNGYFGVNAEDGQGADDDNDAQVVFVPIQFQPASVSEEVTEYRHKIRDFIDESRWDAVSPYEISLEAVSSGGG